MCDVPLAIRYIMRSVSSGVCKAMSGVEYLSEQMQ